MRIGYFGDGLWASGALERILALPRLRVVFVVARPSAPDPELRQWAERIGVPFLVPRDVNAPDFLGTVKRFSPDLNVSMSFDQILGRTILELAPLGFINCHAGALPFYRGRNVLNWALINGEESFGVTVHHVDEGIDTGDVIAQRQVLIAPDDDYSTLLRKAAAVCSELLPETLRAIESGAASRTPQTDIHPVGSYFSRRVEGDEEIDWGLPTRQVRDFVRALVPPAPGARTDRAGRRLAVLKTELITGAPPYIEVPGRILGCTPAGVVVKTGDTSLLVTQTAWVDEDGRLSEPFVPQFGTGGRLGWSPRDRIRALERKFSDLEALCARLVAERAATL